MAGDAIGGARYYEQAAVLFRELDDRTGLISCLAMYAMRGASYVFATVACPPTELADSLSATNEALRLAQQSDWRAGEASVQAYLGLGLGARGEYARALDAFQHCREIAGAIEHRHWLMVAHWGLGALLLDLLDLPAASAELERALAMGRDIGQLFSVHFAGAFLAETYVAQGDLARAAALLAELHDAEMRMDTMALRLVAYARAKLALAHAQPNDALAIADELIDTAASAGPATIIPELGLLRGTALHALGRAAEAERALLSAADAARTQGLAPTYWRSQVALRQLYHSRNQRDLAEAAFTDARATIDQLATNLPDAAMRAQFQARASAQIPRSVAPTPRRAAKQAFAGLTERERQVATLVAQGHSNRTIAATLVVSERTIEKHIENVLSKLGFTSRAQIAVWAVERGLTRAAEREDRG
jgi:ATP/maltotriose-dependent transcriptional regulator MalT